jgi:ribosomal protein L29
MTAAIYATVVEELHEEFRQARAQLVRARVVLAMKDTPVNRAAVVGCRAQIDAILDMHLEIRRPRQ